VKVCVTGATGFIGSNLALKLLDTGHEVVAAGKVNNEIEAHRKSELEQAGIAVAEGDLTEYSYALSVIGGCDWVFHLAAAQHEAGASEEYFHKINVEGTRNVLEACVESGVKSLVHGSSIGVYGSAAQGELQEQSPCQPCNAYERSKLEGERLAISYAATIPVVVARIAETYGPGDLRLLKLFKGIKRRMFFIVGKGNNRHHPIYVDDLIRGLQVAASSVDCHQAGRGEIFVLAGKQTITTRRMCEDVAQAVSTPPPWLRLPRIPFLLIAVIFEKLCAPLNVQPPLHRRRLDFFLKDVYFDCSKAAKELHFTPEFDFAEGARVTAEWYQQKKLL
jgi:nucleoside-diphosphate-sugar epimerase